MVRRNAASSVKGKTDEEENFVFSARLLYGAHVSAVIGFSGGWADRGESEQ